MERTYAAEYEEYLESLRHSQHEGMHPDDCDNVPMTYEEWAEYMESRDYPLDNGPTGPKPKQEQAMTAITRITVRYSSVDGCFKTRTYHTLKGAQKFAQKWVGRHPEIGRTYAVSFDGVGKIEVEGATLADLFPPDAQPSYDDDGPPE